MKRSFAAKILKMCIATLAFAFLILVTINILPVWADQSNDSSSDSVCSSSSRESDTSSPSDESDQNSGTTSDESNDTNTSDNSSTEESVSDTGTTTDTSSAEESVSDTETATDTSSTEESVSDTETTTDTSSTEESVSDTETTTDTSSTEESVSDTETATDTSSTEESVSDTETTTDTSSTEESVSDTETTTDTSSTEESVSDTEPTTDTPSTEEPVSETETITDITTTDGPSGQGGGSLFDNDASQSSVSDQSLEEDPEPVAESEVIDDLVTIPQLNAGDPWGYILDAVTEMAVEGSNIEVWKVLADGTLTKDGIINETNPVGTDASGKYAFTVKTTDNYQLKITKTGYVDLISNIYNFIHTDDTQVENLYLVPLVTDAAGKDIVIKHDLVTGGQNISIIANNLTVNDNIIVDTRRTDKAGIAIGNSGNVTLTGKESLTINTGAVIKADVNAGSVFSPGTITLTAINNTVHGLDLSNMTSPTTSARVTVKGSVSGGDVVIRANTGLQEVPEIVDIDDYSTTDWAIAKLKEYIDMIPLPVVVKMRDDQSIVTIDAGAIVIGSQKVTVESEANAQAKAQANFSKEFIGYCQAQAQAEVNVKSGAVITAGDNVLIRSKALAAADLDVTVDNSKNSKFSLVLGVTDTDLTSHTTIAEGANITGKNVNIQALGNNYNHVSTKSTNSTDGKLMAMLSLNFTDSDVKTEVNGNLTAAGEEITSQKDLNDRLSGGIGVLTRLDSDDLAQVVAGIGGTVTDAKEKDIDDDKAKSAKDMIIGFFQKNYQQKTEKAEKDKKNDSGANKNLQIAAACSCSKVDNDVNTIIGSTADLKSGLDLNVKSELVETAQIQTRSWIEGDNKEGKDPPENPSTAISAAVSIGLYDNTATTTFAGQSDAKRETVISSSISYPFLLEPFKDLSTGTFKDGLNLKDSLGQNLDFAKDVLGLMEEMINSWTISTASGETTGAAGAVTYLEYNNNAAANIKNTARINQRADDVRYRSDDQTVAIDAATDLAQIIVVGNFDFGLSQDDLKEIADKRGMPEPGDKSGLVDPYGVKSGKAGIGGSILLSYVNNNATANIESGARIHAGSDGKIDVTACNQVTNIEFVQSGGQAEKFGVAGSFVLDNETANVLAQINRGTVLEAGALNIKANDASSHLNILGGVMRGDGVGIGCSIGINEITRNIGAGIAQPDSSAQGSTSNIVIAGTTNVEATAKGDILVATVAASLPAKAEDEAPDQSKDTSDTTASAPESGSTGADKSQGKYGIGVSGAVSINEVNDTVRAFVDYSDKITSHSLTVKGTNETNILALTGSAAFTKSSQETSGTLAGAYSQITLNGTTEACVIGTEMDTNSLTLLAERIGNLWAISAGGANSPGKSGIAVAGSVSINNISNNTNAMLDDIKGSVAGPTLVHAKDKSSMHVIAGAEGYGGRGGFGAAVAYNDLQNNTTAKIMHSDWNQKATLELLAQNSIRAGPIDEIFVISGNPADNVEIFAVAASLGISPKGNFGGAGTVAINRIRNTTEASMIDSTCNVTGDGQVTFTGRDDSNIFSIAGAIGGAKNVGIGAAVAYNEISNKVYTFMDGSNLNNPTALSLTTESGGIIKTLSLGAGGAQDVALAGSASVNKINNDASAYIKNSTISVINHIYISSTGSAGIGSVAGGFSGAGKAAIGAAIAINYIGSAANPNQITAYIENSRVTTTDDSNDLVDGHLPGVNLIASDNSTIRSISGGIGAGGAAGLGGAAAYNEVTTVVKAYVQGCKTQGTEIKHVNSTGSLMIKGESTAAIETISAGGAGGKFGAAGSVSINTIGNTVEAYINESTVDVEDNIYLLADSDNVIHGYGGALAGGLVGISGAVVVNTVENTTRSYILHSTVTARGTGSNVAVKNWNDNGDESTEDLKGLFIIADCNDLVELYSGAAAGGSGAVAGQTSVNHIKDTTEAFIGASNINSAADFGQWVKVKAHQGTQVDIWAGGLCVSSAGVGAAVDRTLVENTTRAYISDRDENGADLSPIDSIIYARGLEIIARTREDVNSKLAGIALSGTASGAGAVSVIDVNSNCLAMIARSAVFAQGPVNVYASDKAVLDSKIATFAASGGGSVAGSVVVNTLSNTVKALVLGSNLNATRGIEVKSLGNDKITIMTGGVGLGQGGVGGVVSFNTIQAATESAIANSGARFSLINQDARFKTGGIYAPDANQKVLVRAENNSTVDNTGLAGGAGVYIGGGAAVDVTKVQNRTVAYIGAGSKVYSKGDINIEAQATKIIDSKTAAVGAGLVGISGAVSITSLGEAISSEGAGQFTGELRQQVNSDTSIKNLKINSSDTTAKNAGDKVNALAAPNLDDILSTTQDTSGKITAAYIEDRTAAGAKAEIISDGNVYIMAKNEYTITGTRGQVAGGAVAAGASVTIINTNERTKAFVGNYATLRANNLTVLADSIETATAESYAAQAGLYAGGGNIAHVKLHPLVEASLGSYSNISVLNQAAVTSAVKPQAKASVYGVTVAYGAKAALADAKAETTPIINAYIGQNAQVTCGYQSLGGNPVLSFFSGSELTGNPTLTFSVKSVQMSGNPTLHFAPGSGGANDTVSRLDGGTWGADGFKAGDYISICGTTKNNAVYKIMGISGDGKTLTLDTKGTVQAEDKSGASVYIERGGEITRSTGSWIDDDFVEGEFILVAGTGTNDGYYEIGKIIDASILQLDVSDEISNQVTSSASIIGDTADMIRRSAGNWLDDGFRAGQYIKVSGSANNDGRYRIKSISSDGKVITLDSFNLFTKEQASGVNVTIVDYSDSGANSAGLKVNASESLPDSGSTAEAYAFGAGGALLSADCTMAAAKNTSAVAAWVANNANITVAGTVEISADTATKQTAGADGYNGGAVQAGNNKASATSTASGAQLNITTAGLKDNVNLSAFKLLISSYRTDDNYAEAFAGSGGAFNLVLIEATTANNAATKAALGTGVNLNVDRLQIIADHTATFNSKADSISIAGIGLGAGRANNAINSTVEANIGPSSTILARDMIVNANNRTNKDWLSNSSYNVRSRSGGIVDCQSAESKTGITNTTNINVGDNTTIKIPGSIYNLGRLNMEILNTVLARDKANIDIGGAITGAKAVSQITNTNTGTVRVGKNVTIMSAGDINLSARTYSNIQTYAAAKCYGAAGLADADSKAISTSANNVLIGEGAKITSYGQINLLAGLSSEGFPNTCYSLASADVNNWTAVPLKTSPQASGIINLNNYINIAANASLRAVKDANLLTEEEINVTDGTGTAKNLYSEFLGMDCRTIDTAIKVDSLAQVDGSLEVGIQNQQLLTIEADGTVSTKTDGVIFIKTKYEMNKQILEELELARRMRDEYAGTAAAEAFADEIIRLQGELIQLGHQVYTQNGQTLIEQSVWADYIIVDDIWAQSSNINILAGRLSGSGILKARGDAKIEIINKSPAYLRLNSLTIPENAGGQVVFNRSSLDSGWHNGVRIISGTSSGEPQINIRNTYTGSSNPDIEIYGNIENRNGPLYVSSTGGITSKGDIRAGRVTLNATGDFIQSYVDTFYPVGGEPRNIWKPVTRITELWKSMTNPLDPDAVNKAIIQVLNSEPQSKIEAANIVISARYLNINGAIISGHPEQKLVLGAELNNKIAGFWKSPHWDYHDNLIVENGGVKAYFDLITKRVIVEGVSAEGGYVSLFGQIMNTGGGRIEALDGYASIHIENHTNYDLQVGALDTGRGSEGMVVIRDTAPMTWLPGSYSAPVVRVYTRLGEQVQVWDSVDMNNKVAVYDANGHVVYQPLAGLRYAWVTAQSKLTKTSTTYRKSSWLGVDWLAKDPGAIYEKYTILLDADPLLEGEYIQYRPDLVNSAYTYKYKSEMVTQYDGNGKPIVDGNGNPVPVLVQQDSWVKKTWWGKKTYYLKQVYQKATKDVNYHSIKADYPISIIFKGGTEGTVDITSDHGLFMSGSIVNPNGKTKVSARGSVEQTEGTYIQSQEITVIGDGGIGKNAVLSIDLKGGALTARALQGIINIQELNGELKLIEVTNNNGNVSLVSKGDIIGASPASAVTGHLVSLDSENGRIGTVTNLLLINSGTNSGEGVKAQAYSDIYLKKTAGDFNLIKVTSAAGDVYVEAANGSILDANPEFSRDTITEGFVLGTWNNLKLSGQKTATELRCLLGVTLKTDRKPDIWLEDYNVKGNNLTLKALNGAIGRIAGTVTIDLTELANLNRDSKLTLMAADPKDIKFYDADKNLIAPGDNTTLAKYAVVSQLDEIDVEAGTINAEAGTDVFFSSVGEVGIGRIKGGQVRIRSDRGISNGVNDGSINIISDNLVLIAENGAIGDADKALTLAIKEGSLLRALARDGIYLEQREAGTNRSGNLNIDYIHTPGNVSLQAASSIIRTNTGNAFDIICAGLNLVATGGAIGSAADSLKIEQADGSSLKAIAGTNIFLEELTGNMKVDLISAGGDVNLRTPGSILAAANDEHTAVTGNNINLTAANGQVGEKDLVLVINSSCASPGLVEVNALGDVYIKEAAGILNLGLIHSISKGRVFIASAGGITNGIGAGTNVDANILKIEAVSGVGTPGSPINTLVTRVEGSGGTGGFYLDNQGGLTVGGVDTINGIQAEGNIQLIAHSPITIAEDLAAGGNINIIAGTSAGLDDLVIAQDRKVQAGGLITLTAGDSIRINPNALVKAGTTVDIQAGSSIIIDRAIVDAGGTVTIKTNGGNLTVTNATVKSDDNIDAQASGDVNINNAMFNSGQCTTIQGGRNFNLITGIVDAGDSVDIKAADNILIDNNSAVFAINSVWMAGDFGNNDPGTGCKIEIYGTLTGQYMEARSESDNDEFIINGATIRGPLTLLGGSGNDLYTVTNLHSISSWHNGKKDRITMNGQEGSDAYEVNLVGAGDYIVEALDTGTTGTDILTLNGTPNADKLLLRQKFIANLNGTDVERINYDQNIEKLDIYVFEGDDCFYIDDNSALTNIYGAEGDDCFQIGQMFGSARDANAGVAAGDEIDTVLTTRGYLSRGVSYETKIYGASGNDSFTVYSNQARLELNGEDGNDRFIIRAFALAGDNPHQPRTSVDAGNGDDYIEYNVNAPVDINGGAGNDTVRIIGSEFDDVFVISEHKIVGAGLNVNAAEIECYETYGMEGNDTFYIQGIKAGIVCKIFGGYGSDSFYVLGDVTKHVSTSGTYDTMVDHNLERIKGTLIIEGGLSNEGEDCILVPGVTLPTENNPALSNVVVEDEGKTIDSLYVYNDDSTRGDTGYLTVGHLQGLGMGTGTTINQEPRRLQITLNILAASSFITWRYWRFCLDQEMILLRLTVPLQVLLLRFMAEEVRIELLQQVMEGPW